MIRVCHTLWQSVDWAPPSRILLERAPTLMMWLCSPEELPEGCAAHRTKDDGILDCLRHFKEKGHHIFLCTLDKQFACRSQARTWPLSVNPLVIMQVQAHMDFSYPLRYELFQRVPSWDV